MTRGGILGATWHSKVHSESWGFTWYDTWRMVGTAWTHVGVTCGMQKRNNFVMPPTGEVGDFNIYRFEFGIQPSFFEAVFGR